MSIRFMLDTNVISDLIKDPHGPVASRLECEGESSVCCSIVVAAELRDDVAKAGSAALAKRVDAALSAIEIMPLGEPADVEYGELRAELAKLETPIGANDVLIAAHALSEGLTLVSDNIKEFSRVPSLIVVNWRSR